MSTDSRTCYYPDELTEAKADLPCDPMAEHSACCGAGAYCLGNGLCYDSGAVSRGSCTDQSWNDAACPSNCKKVHPSTGNALRLCSIDSRLFSCSDDCNSTFGLSNDTLTFRPSQAASIYNIAHAAGQVSVSADGSAVASNSSTSSLSSTSTGSGGGGSAGYSAAAMAGLGAGLGVPLFLAFVTMLALWLRERAALRRLKAGMGGVGSGGAGAGAFGLPAELMHHHQHVKPAELDHERMRHELPPQGAVGK
ncbi:uncharacterized protein K452DRAFT_293602 [Aplosporella prunicola CBS 121167]|uniref:Uncharacterized protein n=1 Tax=Aplosporella prunicola CBS 121167 TaxID=1176127 RepID=A0A6A6BSN9_9PEZI|nr:uncharacterized protein K452DRAFT_293602 [Aplosporella prunicola CBS 121167]KAF2147129.1 hypothetical protein K452DRAFT_293602 [Aplosporella prunicola CBS 121167]